MGQRRRSVAVQEPQNFGFTLGNLTNLMAIPLLTGGIILIGFYYTTSGTLMRYGDDIKTLNSKLETTTKVVTDKTTDDAVARAKIRDDFLASQLKTAEGIGKLDTRLAVAETNQKIANDTLNKIADSLQRITAIPAPTK